MIDIDKLAQRQRESNATEYMQFSPKIDVEIINAFVQSRPATLQVKKTPIPVYRCYFMENSVVVTYMTHLLSQEYEIFCKIASDSFNYSPSVSLYVLSDNKVVLERKISTPVFAQLLFRFHHRIAKKYIDEERFLF